LGVRGERRRDKRRRSSMKVAVSSTGNHLDSPIDPRFGRCAYFIFVETDDMTYEAHENQSMSLGGGAGIQSAQFVVSQGARVVITGNCGPNAVRALSAAGIELILGQVETVRQGVEDFKNGRLKASTGPNVPDHYGMGGRGGGGGFGRGGGRGMGRGMGRRLAAGTGDPAPSGADPRDRPTRRQDLEALKDEAQELLKKMEAIQGKIKSLEED
jgi:predicted Fe-Mo cluster-binding NifX family protein